MVLHKFKTRCWTRLKLQEILSTSDVRYSESLIFNLLAYGYYVLARLICQNVWWHLLTGIMTRRMDLNGRKSRWPRILDLCLNILCFLIQSARVGDPHTHEIARVQPNDQGTYTCVVGNGTFASLNNVYKRHLCCSILYLPRPEVNHSRVLGARWFICPHQLPTGCSWPLGFVTSMKNVPVNDNNQTK